MMRTFVAAALAILVFPVAHARADDWTVGPGIAYVSNINHVLDIYKDDVKAQGKTVDVDKALPVGISFDASYQMDTGLRIGVGLGPYFRLTGDVKHFELPINGTVGYLFKPEERHRRTSKADSLPISRAAISTRARRRDFSWRADWTSRAAAN